MKNKARNKFTSPHFFMPKMMIIKSWMILPNNSIIFMHFIETIIHFFLNQRENSFVSILMQADTSLAPTLVSFFVDPGGASPMKPLVACNYK